MSPQTILLIMLAYMVLLVVLGWWSGRSADNAVFFIGGRRTSWWKATLAMVGAAMSGVTFISVPGAVATDSFSYMQMVIGFTIGQLVTAFVFVPMFYRQRVVSLYEWLDARFGVMAHRTGAWCFMVAKLIGTSLKIYVVCAVTQLVVFDYFGLHFIYNVLLTLLLVWLFTYRGGVRSLIVTDILQSLCLVVSVVVVIMYLCRVMGLDAAGAVDAVMESPYSQMWFFDDAASPRYFWKMVFGGALCLMAMTGLDQDMMQRNLSCRTQRESQVNIVLTAMCQIGVILLLLFLGALLYIYIDFAKLSLPLNGDDTFPMVALQGGLPIAVGIVFVLGLVSSTYSAAGSALTSLTTSFVVDILDITKHKSEQSIKSIRGCVHAVMATVIAVLIVVFYYLSEGSAINLVFKIAGYTYGPILGMFLFGIISKREIYGKYLPIVVVLSLMLSYALQWSLAAYLNYQIGFELLGYNALLTIFGLRLMSYSKK